MKPELWFSELQNEDTKFSVRIKNHLFSKESKYQRIDIFESDFYGKVLALDGCFMITEKDEFMYQEMITHPAMMSHNDPRDVLIIGGGDGGVAREVLKYPVKNVHVVEIDEDVISVSKVHLPAIASSFGDERVRIFNQDAFEFVDTAGKYDVIIVDSTDPIGFAASLFSSVFYMKARKILREDGIIVTQSGSPFMNPGYIQKAYRGLSQYFKFVKPYLSFVPSYPSGMWSYVIASDYEISMHRKFTGQYINEEVYASLFNIPEFVKKIVHEKEETTLS
ncbi:MAG: polyamine aminopropyltransferase [Thermoplasmatales archaeon]